MEARTKDKTVSGCYRWVCDYGMDGVFDHCDPESDAKDLGSLRYLGHIASMVHLALYDAP